MTNLRNLLLLSLVVAILPGMAQNQPPVAHGRAVRSLAGQWGFELDPEDHGIAGRWFSQSLADTVQLPGTTDTNRRGRQNDARDADRLSRRWTCSGKAWYRQEVEIPRAWAAKRVALFLERTRVTRVWLDNIEVGAQNVRFSVPHVYDLSGKASPGRHRLTILVDNAQHLHAGGHLVPENTQTKWSGILGRIELMATGPVWMESVRVAPDVKQRLALVRIRLCNSTGKDFEGRI